MVVVEPDGLHFLQMSAAQSHHCVVVVVWTVEPACERIYTETTSDCRRHVNWSFARDTTSKCGCRHPAQCRASTGSGRDPAQQLLLLHGTLDRKFTSDKFLHVVGNVFDSSYEM